MIFVGVALFVAVALAIIVNADAGALVGLGQSETARLIALVAILIVVAGGAFSQRRKLGEILANLVLWGGLFAVAIVGYTFRADIMTISERVLAELAPGAAVVDTVSGSATFHRALSGSFKVNGSVNGADVHFVFDTGASAVVLTKADAEAAGIDLSRLRFTLTVQTANGKGLAALTSLDSIDVGGIQRHDISAFVVDEGSLETSLLGMTFLETLSGYSVANDALVLTD